MAFLLELCIEDLEVVCQWCGAYNDTFFFFCIIINHIWEMLVPIWTSIMCNGLCIYIKGEHLVLSVCMCWSSLSVKSVSLSAVVPYPLCLMCTSKGSPSLVLTYPFISRVWSHPTSTIATLFLYILYSTYTGGRWWATWVATLVSDRAINRILASIRFFFFLNTPLLSGFGGWKLYFGSGEGLTQTIGSLFIYFVPSDLTVV